MAVLPVASYSLSYILSGGSPFIRLECAAHALRLCLPPLLAPGVASKELRAWLQVESG